MTPIRIWSFNVRKSDADDGSHAWHHRRAACAAALTAADPDLVCLQELRPDSAADLAAALPRHAWHGLSRSPGSGLVVNQIAWRRDRFRLLEAGGYWLSSTPHLPGSRSWGSASIRLAVWALLVSREGLRLRLISCHLDHAEPLARLAQAQVLAEESAAWPEHIPQILGGDLNAGDGEPAPAALLAAGWRDSWHEARPGASPEPTFHGFAGAGAEPDPRRIDWLLLRGPLRTRQATVHRRASLGHWPSDHHPIEAVVTSR
jgi:endonuclease/exonuclease/phosphatase family metal-dependent hydrolase